MAKAENKPSEPAKKKRKAGGRPFQKGQSGNPGGRPKGYKELRALALTHCPKAIETLAGLMDSDDERIQKGACDSILDRGIGKPPQAITGEGGGPVQLDYSALSDDELRTFRVLAQKARVVGDTDSTA